MPESSALYEARFRLCPVMPAGMSGALVPAAGYADAGLLAQPGWQALPLSLAIPVVPHPCARQCGVSPPWSGRFVLLFGIGYGLALWVGEECLRSASTVENGGSCAGRAVVR